MRTQRTLLALALAMACAGTFAQEVCKEYTVTVGGGSTPATGIGRTPEAACSGVIGKVIEVGRPVATITASTPDAENPTGKCNVSYTSTGNPGATFSTVGTMIPRDIPCPNQCPPDIPNKVNVTVGYSRTPGGADGKMAVVVSRPWEGGFVCFTGCRYSYGAPIAAWWHDSPTSSGLYRGSMDMNVTSVGGTCSDVDDAAMSQAQENGPACTGSVGLVNGKPYCAGTAQNPVANDQDTNSPLPSNKGNPATGSTGNGGTGSDRTPSTGVGGPAGGPGGTGSVLTPGGGGSGSGTVVKPADGTEQAACGAPGQPKCAIDETGTPGKVADNAYNSKLDGYKTAMDDLRGTAGGASDKGFFSGWTSFFAAPPIAECVPFQFPSFFNVALGSIDPCAVVGGVRQVMAYIWALLAMWLCVGMVTRTVRGS